MKYVYYEHLPIFEVDIFYATDIDALQVELGKYFRHEDIDFVDIVVSDNLDNGGGWAVPIALREDPERVVAFIMFVGLEEGVDTVGHEATHTCNQIFKQVGQLADEINDEVQAYIVGHLIKTFTQNLLGYKKTNNKLIKGRFNRNIGK